MKATSPDARRNQLPYTDKLTLDKSLVLSNQYLLEELKSGTQLEERSKEKLLDSVIAYPEPRVFAQFASKAYKDKDKKETKAKFEESLRLPEGWKLLTTANNLAFKGTVSGYFGTAFWHPDNRWIVIAHRGTVPTNPDAMLRADINGVFRNKYVKQMNAACTFASRIYEAIKECQEEKQTHFEIFFTGHSLGAWLAQITTFSLKYLKLENGTFLKNPNPDGGYHAHTEVFDSPGCGDMLSRMAKDFDVRYSGKTTKLESLDITTYLSSPNFVNCCNSHVGRIFRVYPKITSDQYIKYTLSSHSMNAIKKTFITSDELLIKEVVDWPKIKVEFWNWKRWIMSKTIFGKEYGDFFNWSKNLNYDPKPEDVTYKVSASNADEFVTIRYQTKSARPNERCLNVFTEPQIKFLNKFHQLRIIPNSIFDGDQISDEYKNKIKINLQLLIIEDDSVSCDKNVNIRQLISFAKTLLRLYPNLNERVELALTDFEVRKQIYREITNNYLRKMEKLTQILRELDWPNLVEFLDNNANQVCHIMAEIETHYAMAKALNIIMLNSSNLPGFTIYAFDLQCLLNTETFFHLTEFLKRDELNQTLILLECKSGSFGNLDNVMLIKRVIKRVRKRPDLKLIIITDKTVIISDDLNIINDVGISWNDLNNDTQKMILTNELVIFQGEPNKISLQKLFRLSTTGTDSTHLAKILDNETLAIFLKGEDVIVGKSLSMQGDIYVPRKFMFITFIKEQILNNVKHDDVVAVSGLNKKDLDRHKTLDGIKNDKVKLINSDEDFEALCRRNPGRNVHWMKHEANGFVFHKTRGSMDLIRKLIADDQVTEYSEETLVENECDRKTLIISAAPGMGKSTVLSALARRIKDKAPDHWVMRVNLIDSTEALRTAVKNATPIETVFDAVKFLLQQIMPYGKDSKLNSAFERMLFVKSLIGDGNVVLIFDGFDEISPDFERLVTRLLEMLQMTSVKKILVTTRPHTKEQLEDRLGTLSHTLAPFSKDNQKECLIKIWTKRFNREAGIEDLEKYALESITRLETLMKDRERAFLAIPLQFVLLAEYMIRKLLKGQHQDLEVVSLMDLYGAFVKSKIKIYFKEKALTTDGTVPAESQRKLMNVSIQNMHREYALKLILSEGTWDELEYPEIEDAQKEITEKEVLKAGLMTNTGNNPQFLHRTVAEFFVLDYALSLSKNSGKNAKKLSILSREILLKKEFGVIRTLLESLIKKGNKPEDTKNYLRSFALFLSQNWLNNQSNCLTNDGETVLHRLLEEQRESTFCQLFQLLTEECLTHIPSLLSIATKNGTALHIAVRIGNANMVRLILQHNPDIISQDENESTPMHIAAFYGYFDIISLLIDSMTANNSPTGKGRDIINARNSERHTPLHLASFYGHLEIVRLLLANHADINAVNDYGITALIEGSYYGHLEILKLLLENGADINAIENAGSTSLTIASYKGHLETVRLLLENGSDINAREMFGHTALSRAISAGHLEIASLLLEKGANIHASDDFGSTALMEASSKGYLEIVRLLLDKGADINASYKFGYTPLIKASTYGHLETVRLLVEKGADINACDKDGLTALIKASDEGHIEVVRFLLEKGANINGKDKDGSTALINASYHGHLEIVSLLENHADINDDNDYGITPLIEASYEGHREVVSHLLEKGADINDALTSLIIASYKGHLETVRLLLEKGADINARDKYGSTALIKASSEGHLEVVRLLLDKGADVNVVGIDQRTALSGATDNGHIEIVNLLRENGADKDESTSYQWYKEIARFLLERAADIDANGNNGSTALIKASTKGHLKIVRLLLVSMLASNPSNS